jgi:hypothetical protein
VLDAREFGGIENDIVQNPVRAGLAASPELSRWPSAWVAEAGAAQPLTKRFCKKPVITPPL